MDARHAMQKVDHASRQELSFYCGICDKWDGRDDDFRPIRPKSPSHPWKISRSHQESMEKPCWVLATFSKTVLQ